MMFGGGQWRGYAEERRATQWSSQEMKGYVEEWHIPTMMSEVYSLEIEEQCWVVKDIYMDQWNPVEINKPGLSVIVQVWVWLERTSKFRQKGLKRRVWNVKLCERISADLGQKWEIKWREDSCVEFLTWSIHLPSIVWTVMTTKKYQQHLNWIQKLYDTIENGCICYHTMQLWLAINDAFANTLRMKTALKCRGSSRLWLTSSENWDFFILFC